MLESKHKKLITIRLSRGPVPFNPEVIDPVIIEDVAADHSVVAHNNPLVCDLEKNIVGPEIYIRAHNRRGNYQIFETLYLSHHSQDIERSLKKVSDRLFPS